jgi:hypothetical protein
MAESEHKTVSLLDLGEHTSHMHKLVRDAYESDEDEPTLSYAELRKRCHAVLALLDGENAEDSPPDFKGKPKNPTGASDVALGRSTLGRDEAFGGETQAQKRRAVAELFGTPNPVEVVDRLVRNTHIASPELGALKGKR